MARGLSKQWRVRLLKSSVHKRKQTLSQTTNDRFGRWENVQNMFRATAHVARYRHVLIVV